MIEVRQTDAFAEWLSGLTDRRARDAVVRRIARIQIGNFGDHKSVGDRVSELRIDYGPGYRAYYTRVGTDVVFMLGGGDKDTQTRDIAKAKELAAEVHR